MNCKPNDEWFEIKEQKSNRFVYVNSNTGKSQFKPPSTYKKFSNDQSWELFDFKSKHFYYYIVKSGKTTWVKPENSSIISLVKFQILKERRKKIFVDKSVQFDADFDIDSPQLPANSLRNGNYIKKENNNHSDVSVDNIETSGYSSTQKSCNILSDRLVNSDSIHNVDECQESLSYPNYRSMGDNYYQNQFQQKQQHQDEEDEEEEKERQLVYANKSKSCTLPNHINRRRVPRTNPNIVPYQHNQLRLSQPSLESEGLASATSDPSGLPHGSQNDLIFTNEDNQYHQHQKLLSTTEPIPRRHLSTNSDSINGSLDLCENTRHRLDDSSIDSGTVDRMVVPQLQQNKQQLLQQQQQPLQFRTNSVDPADNGLVDSSMEFTSYSSLPSSNSNTRTKNVIREMRVPRRSVINAIQGGESITMEIWPRDLFQKSDRQLAGLMSWNPKSIADSLLALTPKPYKKKSCENFKQIQMYMGDREARVTKEKLALAICRRGILSSAWANEIFMQLCKQVTFNPNPDRTFHGWELMCICLKFFHPDTVQMKTAFKSFLSQYINPTLDNVSPDKNASLNWDTKIAICAKAAAKLLNISAKASDVTIMDIYDAKRTYSSPTVFHSDLSEVMMIQKPLLPTMKLPWILIALTKEILLHNGHVTQGIMRIPSEQGKIESLIQGVELTFRSTEDYHKIRNYSTTSTSCDPILSKILKDNNLDHDPLLFASVVKNWLRYMPMSLIPFEEFEDSLADLSKDFNKLILTLETLPELNFYVLKYLISFLQVLSREDNVAHTNMPVENLVTLMAPTLFRLEIANLQSAMKILQNLVLYWNVEPLEEYW